MWDIYNYYGRLHPAGDRQDRQTHRSPFAEGGHPAEKRGGRGRLRNRLTELAEALDLDIDTLLAREDFIGVLTREYGFSDENLEKFAELLFDFAAASPDRDATVRLACGITAIYRYLDEKKALVSLNRYYILKELENMTAR